MHTQFFAVALAHNTNESRSGVVRFEDLDAEIIELVLRYANGQAFETIRNVDKNLYDLFVVADRLLMAKLKVSDKSASIFVALNLANSFAEALHAADGRDDARARRAACTLAAAIL